MSNQTFDQRFAHLYDTAAGDNQQRHPDLQHSLLGPGGLSAMAQSEELRALQMKGDGDADGTHAAAAQGVAGSGGRLPHGERIQAAFGHHDVSDVQAHVGGAAEQAAMLMNAQAYATGRNVAFARQPDLHTAAHEAAHVVQQRGGVSLKGGVGQAGDAHERHADAVADAVVAGRSAEGLLDQYAGNRSAPTVQRKAAQTPGAATAPAPKAGATLGDMLKALETAATPKARQAAALALSAWCRDNLIDDDKLTAYLARPDLDDVEKTRVLGELKVTIARNEFMLGWSHRGGVDAGGSDGWEITPHKGKTAENRGPYPSHYLSEVNTPSGEEWCTSFAGNAHVGLGFSPGPRDEKAFRTQSRWEKAERSMFRSGTRLLTWSRNGQGTGKKPLTASEDAIASGKAGSLLLDSAVWRGLTARLRRADEGERGQTVDDAFAKHGAPQAGDVLVLGEDNNFRGASKSHTALIESYDAASRTIYTVEGNTEHAVLGRRFDLTDADVASKIVCVSRVGASFFQPERGGCERWRCRWSNAAGADGQAARSEGGPARPAWAPDAEGPDRRRADRGCPGHQREDRGGRPQQELAEGRQR